MRQLGDVFLPKIVLDRLSAVPLHEQIRSQIARIVRQGAPGGGRLPSTRMLAGLLGVSRNTVLTAYDLLVSEGLIQGRLGSGMRIRSSSGGAAPFDLRRVLREAHYPVRTLNLADPDGTPLHLNY